MLMIRFSSDLRLIRKFPRRIRFRIVSLSNIYCTFNLQGDGLIIIPSHPGCQIKLSCSGKLDEKCRNLSQYMEGQKFLSFVLFGSNTSSLLIFKGLCSSLPVCSVLCLLFSPLWCGCSLLVPAVWRRGEGSQRRWQQKSLGFFLSILFTVLPNKFLKISYHVSDLYGVGVSCNKGYVEKERYI